MKLHHLGVASLDLEKTIQSILTIFPNSEVGETVYDSLQDVFLCLVKAPNGTIFEIVCGEKVRRIALAGFRLYHICVETEDYDGTMAKWFSEGFDLISDSKPAVLFNGRRVAFWRTEIGLVELLEAADEHG